MKQTQNLTTPVILALTRRAMLCGLPYNTFIVLLIGGCVAFIWIDSMSLVAILLALFYAVCHCLCRRDIWALDIFFMRMQQIGVCPWGVKKYFNSRNYGA